MTRPKRDCAWKRLLESAPLKQRQLNYRRPDFMTNAQGLTVRFHVPSRIGVRDHAIAIEDAAAIVRELSVSHLNFIISMATSTQAQWLRKNTIAQQPVVADGSLQPVVGR